jgi:hypothetical protein
MKLRVSLTTFPENGSSSGTLRSLWYVRQRRYRRHRGRFRIRLQFRTTDEVRREVGSVFLCQLTARGSDSSSQTTTREGNKHPLRMILHNNRHTPQTQSISPRHQSLPKSIRNMIRTKHRRNKTTQMNRNQPKSNRIPPLQHHLLKSPKRAFTAG